MNKERRIKILKTLVDLDIVDVMTNTTNIMYKYLILDEYQVFTKVQSISVYLYTYMMKEYALDQGLGCLQSHFDNKYGYCNTMPLLWECGNQGYYGASFEAFTEWEAVEGAFEYCIKKHKKLDR